MDYSKYHCQYDDFSYQAKAMILAVAFSLVNAMKQLVLPKEFSKSRMSTLRTLFIKIAGKSISHAKKIKMRLCSSAPYKEALGYSTNTKMGNTKKDSSNGLTSISLLLVGPYVFHKK